MWNWICSWIASVLPVCVKYNVIINTMADIGKAYPNIECAGVTGFDLMQHVCGEELDFSKDKDDAE